MKYISYIVNGVLVIAVAVLFYLHFSPGKAEVSPVSGQDSSIHAARKFSIVYVNIDTLLHNYDYYYELQDKFQAKQTEMESELDARSKKFQEGARDLQDKVNKGLVTRREAAELQQQLGEEQQNLLSLRDQLSQQLAEEEQVSNHKLINRIMEYLQDYNKNYHYQFIFSNSFGDNVLFANDSLDITSSVLEGLNREYNAEQADK